MSTNKKKDLATCGSCGLSWDDSIATSWTPAPSARCPFEHFHKYDKNGEPIRISFRAIPKEFPVRPIKIGNDAPFDGIPITNMKNVTMPPETPEVKELKDMVYRAQLMLSRKEYMETAKLIDDDQYLALWLKSAKRILTPKP